MLDLKAHRGRELEKKYGCKVGEIKSESESTRTSWAHEEDRNPRQFLSLPSLMVCLSYRALPLGAEHTHQAQEQLKEDGGGWSSTARPLPRRAEGMR